MMRYGLAVVLLVGISVAASAQSGPTHASNQASDENAAPGRSKASNAQGPKIRNQVLDLLEGEIPLDSTTEQTIWQSRPFDTARFNRVVVRVETQEGSDPVICSLWWQFSRGDTFLPGPPIASVSFVGDDTRLEPVGLTPINSSEIFGLRARAVCQLFQSPDFGRPEPPAPTSAVLTEVKVLLRLE